MQDANKEGHIESYISKSMQVFTKKRKIKAGFDVLSAMENMVRPYTSLVNKAGIESYDETIICLPK